MIIYIYIALGTIWEHLAASGVKCSSVDLTVTTKQLILKPWQEEEGEEEEEAEEEVLPIKTLGFLNIPQFYLSKGLGF